MRAVLALARRFPTGLPERVEALAAGQGIPPNYLVQILIELKSQRLVRSLRGKDGGYVLARPPAEITVGDVLRSIHGQIFDSPAMEDQQCPPELRAAWKRLQNAVNTAADAMNFQMLLEEGADPSRMYFI